MSTARRARRVTAASRMPRQPFVPRCCWCFGPVEGMVMTCFDGALEACRSCGEKRGTFWAEGEEEPEYW